LPQASIIDTDGDGVQDSDDDYPANPELAFNNVFPATGFSTLMFEDLWPSKGDFDFNDIVVDYRINRITNANNKVVKIDAKFVLRAIGASYKNGFAFQFDGLAPSKVLSLSGNKIRETLHSFASNGTESNQANAVIVVFDNAYKVLTY